MSEIECSHIGRKNHHYVQDSIQKNFKLDWKGFSQLYKLNITSKSITKKNSKNNFSERRLYPKIKLSNLGTNYINYYLEGIDSLFLDKHRCIECNMADYLETPYVDLVNKILLDEKFNFTKSELNLLQKYFYYQFLRTPMSKEIAQNTANEIFNNDFANKDNIKINLKSTNNDLELKLKNKIYDESKYFTENENNWIIQMISNFSYNHYNKSLGFDKLKVQVIKNVSDLPFVLSNFGFYMEQCRNYILPLSPKYILVMGDNSGIKTINDTLSIDKINNLFIQSADEICSSDLKYLELLKNKIENSFSPFHSKKN
jgi:hypothetical protein